MRDLMIWGYMSTMEHTMGRIFTIILHMEDFSTGVLWIHGWYGIISITMD